MTEAIEAQFLHLSDAAARLPFDGHLDGNLGNLKSHFIWVCSEIANNVSNKSRLCLKCCQPWRSGKFSLKVKPSSPGPSMLKVLKKSESGDKLSRVESSLYKRHQKNHQSITMVLTCKICTLNTTVKCQKPIVTKAVHAETLKIDSLPAKKKKKKDHFAGLKKSAVISASSSSQRGGVTKPPNVLNSAGLTTHVVKKVHSDPLHKSSSASAQSNNTSTVQNTLHRLNRKESLGPKQKMSLLHSHINQLNRVKREEDKRMFTIKKMLNTQKKGRNHLQDKLHCLLNM